VVGLGGIPLHLACRFVRYDLLVVLVAWASDGLSSDIDVPSQVAPFDLLYNRAERAGPKPTRRSS
jgi:hypothetical protein